MKSIKLEITKEESIYLIEHTNKTLSIHKNIFGVLLNIFKNLKN